MRQDDLKNWWRMGKILQVNRVFLIPLISVLIAVFDEMVVPVIVWVFPTDSHELEYPHDHMCMSDVKPPTACDCGWDGVCEGSVMIIEHQSHSQCNTDPKYPVCESECGDAVLFVIDWRRGKGEMILKRIRVFRSEGKGELK